jgi:hypothetical protein
MTVRAIDDPRYWRAKEEEALVLAEYMTNPGARQMMLRIAEGYALMARPREERLRQEPPSP